MSKDWKLKIKRKSTLNILLKFFLKILVPAQNSLAWVAVPYLYNDSVNIIMVQKKNEESVYYYRNVGHLFKC